MDLASPRGPLYSAKRLWKHHVFRLSTKSRCPVSSPLRKHHTIPTNNPRTPKITSISPTVVPAKRAPWGRLHSPSGPWAQHELYLDFRSTEPRITSHFQDKVTVDPPRPPLNPYFLASIRTAVAETPDIDAVHLSTFNGHLNKEVWEALSGLQPTHLEMSTGFDEYCDYAGLANVTPPWPLKSLYIATCEGDGESDTYANPNPQHAVSFPACYANIETLVMHFPCSYSVYFYPKGGARNLRSLTVSRNDVVSAFSKTVACNPELLRTLRSVTLDSDRGENPLAVDVDRMLGFFCHSTLERLELLLNDSRTYGSTSPSTGHNDSANNGLQQEDRDPAADENTAEVLEEPQTKNPYLDIPSNLPPSLTFLSFRGPVNLPMLQELDKWIASANDPAWLPNLRSVAFRLDLQNELGKGEELAEGQEALMKQKVETFLDTLAGRSPSVKAVEPRDPKELVYPLPV